MTCFTLIYEAGFTKAITLGGSGILTTTYNRALYVNSSMQFGEDAQQTFRQAAAGVLNDYCNMDGNECAMRTIRSR
jgi:CheY-specific phosphatase CheX